MAIIMNVSLQELKVCKEIRTILRPEVQQELFDDETTVFHEYIEKSKEINSSYVIQLASHHTDTNAILANLVSFSNSPDIAITQGLKCTSAGNTFIGILRILHGLKELKIAREINDVASATLAKIRIARGCCESILGVVMAGVRTFSIMAANGTAKAILVANKILGIIGTCLSSFVYLTMSLSCGIKLMASYKFMRELNEIKDERFAIFFLKNQTESDSEKTQLSRKIGSKAYSQLLEAIDNDKVNNSIIELVRDGARKEMIVNAFMLTTCVIGIIGLISSTIFTGGLPFIIALSVMLLSNSMMMIADCYYSFCEIKSLESASTKDKLIMCGFIALTLASTAIGLLLSGGLMSTVVILVTSAIMLTIQGAGLVVAHKKSKPQESIFADTYNYTKYYDENQIQLSKLNYEQAEEECYRSNGQNPKGFHYNIATKLNP